MRFGYTIVYVPDILKTLIFYENAFGFKRKFVAESELYAELDTGATTLSFCAEAHVHREGLSFQPLDTTKPAPAIEVAFFTDDVEGAFAKAIAAGATAVTEPKTTHWGQRIAYVRDLNGLLVELCTPLG